MRLLALFILLIASVAYAEPPTIALTQVLDERSFLYDGADQAGEIHRYYYTVERKHSLPNGMSGYKLLGYFVVAQTFPLRDQGEELFQYDSGKGLVTADSREEALKQISGLKEYTIETGPSDGAMFSYYNN